LLPDEGNCVDENTFGDGGENSGPDVNLTFSGASSAMIFGGVRGLNNNLYSDVFTIKGNRLYQVTLSSIQFTDPGGIELTPPAVAPFDATWSLGGTTVGTISNLVDPQVLSLSGVFDLSALTVFDLDASGGGATDGNIMEYKVTVSAVPLPAGAVLLLSGLGGVALLRRRRKA
jgi:hypothetical protein